jgi:hypothetical protein
MSSDTVETTLAFTMSVWYTKTVVNMVTNVTPCSEDEFTTTSDDGEATSGITGWSVGVVGTGNWTGSEAREVIKYSFPSAFMGEDLIVTA